MGKDLVVIGRGTERGEAIMKDGTLRGWSHGAATYVQRWGENSVAEIFPYNGHDLLYATFDANGLDEEAHLSGGDSGGAVFVQDEGEWKLAGVNYAIDELYQDVDGGGSLTAAIFDARGYFEESGDSPGQYVEITGDQNVPTGFYASRISTELAWIYSIIDPEGDPEGDGIPNLFEHALKLNPLVNDGSGNLPAILREGETVSLIYRKNTVQNDLTFEVRQSENLTDWDAAEVGNGVTLFDGYEVIKAAVNRVMRRHSFCA